MFRFTIRELLLVTVVAALGLAWGIDRGSLAGQLEANKKAAEEASDDARRLADLTEPGRRLCGFEGLTLIDLRKKYGARTVSPFEALRDNHNSN